MPEPASDLIALPDDAPARVRRALGLGQEEDLRLLYFPGPGDVIGTHAHWRAGRPDPRVPVLTYSAQFYALAEALGAAFVTVAQEGHPVEVKGGRFAVMPRRPAADPADWKREHMRLTRAVADLARAERPHVAVLSSDFGTEALSQMPRGTRVILSLHNTFWPYGRPGTGLRHWLRRRRLARRLRGIHGAVCTSEECRRQIARLAPHTDNYPVEVPQLPLSAATPAADRSPGPPRRLTYLGRIEPDKGVFDLLEAFVQLSPRFPDAELAFAGSGSAASELQDRIGGLGSEARVRFLGRLDATGVHARLAASDLVVCPTRSSFPEGLALVCLEAASHGVPALMSSIVPARDALEGACAVFEADDRAALLHELESLMSDGDRARALGNALLARRAGFFDRSRSWGAQLCRAMAGEGGGAMGRPARALGGAQ